MAHELVGKSVKVKYGTGDITGTVLDISEGLMKLAWGSGIWIGIGQITEVTLLDVQTPPEGTEETNVAPARSPMHVRAVSTNPARRGPKPGSHR